MEKITLEQIVQSRITFATLAAEQLPDFVAAQFVDYANRYEPYPQEKDLVDLEFIGMAISNDEIDTYVCGMTKQYSGQLYTAQELTFWLVDVFQDEIIGHSELRISNHQDLFFKNKPFVGGNSTEARFRQHGLGTRRLMIMNELAFRVTGNYLHSDNLMTPEAMAIWQKLVERGLAAKYSDTDKTNKASSDRYKFQPKAEE